MTTTDRSTDWVLLRQFVDHRSDQAFAALAARHANLVYSTCRRELEDKSLAEDAAVSVFLLLARKAPSIRRSVPIAGWLFQTARFVAKNVATRERRRRIYELEAARMQSGRLSDDDELWLRLDPEIDDALGRLCALDREALLLRFWSDLSLAHVGAALGVSEDAARMRVSRAVDRLRAILVKQGAGVGAATLAALLAAHAATAAPPALSSSLARIAPGALQANSPQAGLPGSSVHAITQGAIAAMKVANAKVAALSLVMVIFGFTAYSTVRTASTATWRPDRPPSANPAAAAAKLLAGPSVLRAAAEPGDVSSPAEEHAGAMAAAESFFAAIRAGDSAKASGMLQGAPEGLTTAKESKKARSEFLTLRDTNIGAAGDAVRSRDNSRRWLVPYRMALPGGTVRKGRLSVRNDTVGGRWEIDGGI